MTTDLILPRKHLVHKPVELRNLSPKVRDSIDMAGYIYQPKYDGCSVIIVVRDGKASAYSREGKQCVSIPHCLEVIEQFDAPNMVYFGEAYSFYHEFPDISGMFRRQSPQANLGVVLFDAVPLSDFVDGYCPVPYASRLRNLSDLYYVAFPGDVSVGNVFLPPKENDLDTVRGWIDDMRYEDGPILALDGLIARNPDAPWIAGAGKGGEIIKVKDHVSVDLRVVGLVEGNGKFAGTLGAIKVEYRGKVLQVSCGKMTDEERRRYWNYRSAQRGGLLGAIVEIHALSDSKNGVLREPRFQRVRDDKTEPSE